MESLAIRTLKMLYLLTSAYTNKSFVLICICNLLFTVNGNKTGIIFLVCLVRIIDLTFVLNLNFIEVLFLLLRHLFGILYVHVAYIS